MFLKIVKKHHKTVDINTFKIIFTCKTAMFLYFLLWRMDDCKKYSTQSGFIAQKTANNWLHSIWVCCWNKAVNSQKIDSKRCLKLYSIHCQKIELNSGILPNSTLSENLQSEYIAKRYTLKTQSKTILNMSTTVQKWTQ